MVRWLVSRRAVLLAGLSTLVTALPAFAAKTPTLSPVGQVTGGLLQLTLKSPVAIKAYLEWGFRQGSYTRKTSLVSLAAGKSTTLKISGIPTGATVWYRLRYSTGSKTFLALVARSAVSPVDSKPYVFAIQADPHMDENSSESVYVATLKQIASISPSFVMDLGDIFMVDKLADKSEVNIRARYQLMKDYYKNLNGIPLKIVLGNHDGELGYSTFNTKKYRAEYFPEQTADLSYFSFTESNVLHIALDPFTFTTQNPKSDGWQWTLGKTQYDWLKQTLETSTAKFKFIYIHHLLCMDAQSRGGVKIASFNEWGGANQDGTDGFTANRPGWSMPIHALLVKNGVNAVFKGHDHLYAKEELDGIVYQTLPQPSHPGEATNSAVPYGYGAAKVVGGSGYLKVSTMSTEATIEFIKFDGTVADSYKITV